MPDLPRCRACGHPIPRRRLDALPTTPWCLACAETHVPRVGGRMRWDDPHAPELELYPSLGAARDDLRRATRSAFAEDAPTLNPIRT
jgi:hypothetical protein